MTDTSQTLDAIDWWKSPIILKQVGIAAVSLAALFGVVLTPEQTALIVTSVTAIATLGVSVWTIYSRKKPCPPIKPGVLPQKPTDGVTS